MAEVKYNTCDIKGCDNRATCIKTSLQVIFRTEQTEGRSSTPYLQNVTVDLCTDCLNRIIDEQKYVSAVGDQGYNEFFFQAN